jgi:hypothetical protein
MYAAVLAALSCLTRYAGVANVLAGVVIILGSNEDWRRKIMQSVGFGAIGLAPIALWAVRNALAAGTLSGNRLPSPYPILLNLGLVADSIALWFVPDEIPQVIRVTGVVIASILIGYGLWKLNRVQGDGPESRDRIVLAVTAGAHVIVLVVATSVFASDYISTRFVMPIYVPLVALILAIGDWYARNVRRAVPVVLTVLVAWVLIQAVTTVRLVADRYSNGVGGYATAEWRESQVMQFVEDHPSALSAHTFSNAALGIYYHTQTVVDFFPDRLNARWSGAYPVDALAGRQTIEDVRSLAAQPGESVTLIWFLAAARNPRYESIYLFNQYDLDEVREQFLLDTVYEGDDGGVYRLTVP